MAKSRIAFRFAQARAASLLLVAGMAFTPAWAADPPLVATRPSSPGWITVYGEHTGEGVSRFDVERQDVPYSANSVVPVAQAAAPPADSMRMRIRIVSPSEGPWSPPIAFDLLPAPPRPTQPIAGQAQRPMPATPALTLETPAAPARTGSALQSRSQAVPASSATRAPASSLGR